jgi:hypothetical protein
MIMRTAILCLAILPTLALAEPQSAFKPLAFLAGHCWKGTFPGGKQSDEHCFSWVYEGKFLRDVHTLRSPGQPDAMGESIYVFDSLNQRLEYLYIESDGGFARGEVATDSEALVFPDTALIQNGQKQVYRARWTRSGAHAYEVATEFKTNEGWVSGFKVHMDEVAGR